MVSPAALIHHLRSTYSIVGCLSILASSVSLEEDTVHNPLRRNLQGTALHD